MKIGNNDVLKIYFGDNEVSKIYLGNTVLYDGSTPGPTPSSGPYISNNTTLVLPQGLEMPLWLSSSSSTYILPEDVQISDLLNQASGTLSDQVTYTYYPTLTSESNISGITTSRITGSGSITYNGISYTDGAGYTASNRFWTEIVIPKFLKSSSATPSYGSNDIIYDSTQSGGSFPPENPFYYIIKVTGATPGALLKFTADNLFSAASSSNSNKKTLFPSVIVSETSDFTDTNTRLAAWEGSTTDDVYLLSMGYVGYLRGTTVAASNYKLEFTVPQNGEFYVSFLARAATYPTLPIENRCTKFSSSGYMLTELYNQYLGLDIMASNWAEGATTPDSMQISIRELDGYMDSHYKYLIRIQRNGTADIIENPNYNPNMT